MISKVTFRNGYCINTIAILAIMQIQRRTKRAGRLGILAQQKLLSAKMCKKWTFVLPKPDMLDFHNQPIFDLTKSLKSTKNGASAD